MKLTIMIGIYLVQYLLVAFLTDLCLRKWARTEGQARRLRKFWLPAYTVCALLPVAGTFLADSPLKFTLQAAGNIWLGFHLYYGGTLVLLTVALGLWHLFRLRRDNKEAGWYGWAICLSLALSLCVCGYGLLHAQQPKTAAYDLAVDKQAEGIQSMKVVLIADLHLSVNSRLSTTERMVELINREAPDLVVVAGDIFTSSYDGLRHPERYARALRKIRSKYGVYAVYGNHDVEEGLFGGFAISPLSQAFRSDEMEAFFRESGFVTLEDEMVTLPGGVQLAGRIDGMKAGDGTKHRAAARDLLKGADRDRPILVVEHEPVEFQELAEAEADVILCGHTHAGQIFPGTLIVPLRNENGWGLKEVHGADTVVTAGVGYYGPPMRIGTDSEITVIDMRFATGV